MNLDKHCPNIEKSTNGSWCKAVFDGFLCWQAIPPGEEISLKCPQLKGLDLTKTASRNCSSHGLWLNDQGLPDNDTSDEYDGWTNYLGCYTSDMKDIVDQSEQNEASFEDKAELDYLETCSDDINLKSVKSQLEILRHILKDKAPIECYGDILCSVKRSLRSPKTNIHKNLFIALLLHLFVRLCIYFDQIIVKSVLNASGIDNNVSSPSVIVAIWATVNSFVLENTGCWGFYSMSPYYWILEGPRFASLAINSVFLIITLRIVHGKLERTTSSRRTQIMKSAKAAIVLMPLLGLCNGLQMIPAPLHKSPLEFGAWAISSHVFTAFQGFFIALLYCFMNKRVKSVVYNRWKIFSTKYDINQRSSKSRRRSHRLPSTSRQGMSDTSVVTMTEMCLQKHPDEKHELQEQHEAALEPEVSAI
ncbi:PDF receptor [Nymphon striatum]|nr:PDF receptor [Nymphon striatum]